ncbi:MAG: hypothetical protein M1818_004885 [Claussenomyces sp. TS43310]|nr:MAG: hypothetical protein M1818_004885 [Claussenomyces sp. TS43310]
MPINVASMATLTRAASSESVLTTTTNEASRSRSQSLSSTPPTSAADSASISSASLNVEGSVPCTVLEHNNEEVQAANSSSRPRRSRHSVFATYNVKILAGTAIHAPRKFHSKDLGKDDMSTRRRTISSDTLVETLAGSANGSYQTVIREASSLVHDGNRLDLQWLPKKLPKSRSSVRHTAASSSNKTAKPELERRISTRSSGAPIEDLAKKLNILGKRGRNAFEAGLTKAKRELKRLADTNEFAGIDTKPVVHTVWANGKFIAPGEPEPPQKKTRVEATVPAPVLENEKKIKSLEKKKGIPKGPKKWLEKGLYAGQGGNVDWSITYTNEEKKKLAEFPEYKPNGFMPLPMWQGQHMLLIGRDFKLPFDICSPLPPGQPKPDEWRRMPKNRFVGDAAAAWKKSTLFDDFSSRCICTPATGCDESCQNRIMLYECDAGNCAFGKGHCSNRSFADLQERRSKGGKYRIGVEVIKTLDRGYGVRSNRCFEPNQIITEYTGEIITEAECDRRMNEEYKDNDCYYLMSFDQNTILDATEKGSIARFVNHSCEPNCRMVKWVVGGKPRMALFAGERPIMTGEELTYDYNFDPFSAKNVQECRCGSANCRGILGPRPKDQKMKPTGVGAGLKRAVNAGKRKLQELLGAETDGNQSESKTKKRKIAMPVPIKTSAKALEAIRGLKQTLSKRLGPSAGSEKFVVVKKRSRVSMLKTRGTSGKRQAKLSSKHSSLTVVAASDVEEDVEVKKVRRKGKGKEIAQVKAKLPTKAQVLRHRKPSLAARKVGGEGKYQGHQVPP